MFTKVAGETCLPFLPISRIIQVLISIFFISDQNSVPVILPMRPIFSPTNPSKFDNPSHVT